MSFTLERVVRQLLCRSLAAGHVQAAQTGWLCAAAATATAAAGSAPAAAFGQQSTRHCSSWSHLLQGQLQPSVALQHQPLQHKQHHQQQQQQATLCSRTLVSNVQQQQQQQQQSYCFSSSSRVMSTWAGMEDRQRHSTTILCVRRGSEVVIMGDGQATQNDFIVKPNVRKVRRIGPSAVGGFAGVAVDGLALLEKLEAKLEEHPGQLLRASVELAKMWRQDKLLRELDASLIVADAQTTLWLMGNGDVLEAGADGVIGIGSGADFAESAARALLQLHNEAQQQQQQQQDKSSASLATVALPAEAAEAVAGMSLFDVAKKAMRIAADCCVYTNVNFSWHHIQPDGSIVSGDTASAAAAATAVDQQAAASSS